MAQGFKTGGKVKGSKNKSTLARLAAIDKACEMIANASGSKVFEGDAQALLTAIYKCESFPLDVRMRAAEMANTRERPALQAVDSNVREQRTYVVEMPAPVKDLEEWKRLHMNGETPAEFAPDADWKERLARIIDNTKDQQH